MELEMIGFSEIYKCNFIDCEINKFYCNFNKRETAMKLFLMLLLNLFERNFLSS